MQPNFQSTDFQTIENSTAPRSQFVVKTDAFSYCSFRRNRRNWLSDDSFQRSGAGRCGTELLGAFHQVLDVLGPAEGGAVGVHGAGGDEQLEGGRAIIKYAQSEY